MIQPKTPLSRLLNEKRQELLAVCARHGARNLRVFGSVARGEDRPDSDIDLLVDMEDGHGFFDMIAFEDEVRKVLGKEVDLVTEGSVSPYIRESVLSGAAPL